MSSTDPDRFVIDVGPLDLDDRDEIDMASRERQAELHDIERDERLPERKPR